MAKAAHKRKRTKTLRNFIGTVEAGADLGVVHGNTVPYRDTVCVQLVDGRWLATHDNAAAIRDTKQQAENALRRTVHRERSVPDFYASVSAAELVRSQGVQAIRKRGQIRTFSDPDPKEADWLANEVRRWRREGQQPTARR